MNEVFKSELQIVENYLFLFLLPFCIGAILRTLLRKREKGFIITIVLGVISAIMYFMVYTDSAATVFGITYRESFAFWAMDIVMVFIGSLITEIALAIIKRKNNKKSVSA
ncbi:MAG: hypothetical protein IKT89_01490 [Clostridia bacterium]|nr:hypothetical protein [Clostridia bacterium]